MHSDELDIPEELVRRLVDAQFPAWRALPLTRVPVWGTDNAMYRLGDELVVRLPRHEPSVLGLQKEQQWLPVLAPHLPVPVPEPVAAGTPAHGYPLPWAVFRWLDGIPAREADADYDRLARDLAGFIRALQQVALPDRPVPSGRGIPLAEREVHIRARIPDLEEDGIDTDAVTAVWDHALAAEPWHGPPVWLHGDLMRTNLLLSDDGGLAGVIDFGACALGDPACEALAAWMSLTGETRGTFRELLGLDDAAWARARGWALSCAVMALPYYRVTYPEFAELARRTFAEVLADDLE